MLKSVIVYLVAVFIASASQAILKWAALRNYAYWWQGYLNAYVIGAYGLLIVSFLLSLWAYRQLPLSLGAILATTCYFYAVLFGRIFFGERLTRRKLLGLGMIAGGICIYAVAG